MKVKVNIRECIEANAEPTGTLLAHASVDVDELFENNCIPEEQEIDVDIHELLAQNRRIAHVWGVEDVQELRPELDHDQAWAVLQTVFKRLHSDYGITWDSINRTAGELFPEKRKCRWQGRIDVSVENYTRDAAIDHLWEMAEHVQRDAVNSTTRAVFDPASLRLAEPGETISRQEAPHEA